MDREDRDSELPYVSAEDGTLLFDRERSEPTNPLARLSRRGRGGVVAVGLLMVAGALMAFIKASGAAASSATTTLASGSSQWHGVSLGGWLVMEINPSKRGPTSPMDLRPQCNFHARRDRTHPLTGTHARSGWLTGGPCARTVCACRDV